MMNTFVEEAEGRLASCCLAQVTEFLLLTRADDRELAHASVGLGRHAVGHSHDALGQRFGQTGAVERIIVLHDNTARLYLNVDLKLGNVQFQEFVSKGLASNFIFREDAHLIGISDGRTETVVAGDACEGIVLMAQCSVEGLTDLL